MKLLFLDIDGVMNGDFHSVRSKHHPDLQFDPEAVKTLEEIVLETKCKIVITSTWRRGRTTDELRQIFRIYSDAIADAIIGKTGTYSENEERQYEIRKYLQYYRGNKRAMIESFVAIDDDVEFDLYDMPNNTVSTKDKDGLRGLRYYMKQKVIDILNS